MAATEAMSRTAAGAESSVPRPRPAEQLAAVVRRAIWIMAIALVALAAPLFAWTLGRARHVPPASAALPRADVLLLQQNELLASRLRADQQAMDALSRRLERTSGPGGAASLTPVAALAPPVHTVTRAS